MKYIVNLKENVMNLLCTYQKINILKKYVANNDNGNKDYL